MHWLDLVWLVVPASSDPASPTIPWGELPLSAGGDCRDRRHLDGLLHRPIEGQAAGPAQRPQPERGTRARRRIDSNVDDLSATRPAAWPERDERPRGQYPASAGSVIFAAALVAVAICGRGCSGMCDEPVSARREETLLRSAPPRFAGDTAGSPTRGSSEPGRRPRSG